MMHHGVMPTTRSNSFFPVWVRQRELRHRLPLGHTDTFYKSLYTTISQCHSWGGGKTFRSEHGGVFSLEFSPDGSHLVAGCEKSSFLMFDPLSRRLIRTVHNANASVVMHVKFLDSRTFATGDLNETISLWDIRNLKSPCRTLHGHSSPIANLEFSQTNDLLITSGLNGYIYTWDTKNWNQREQCNSSTFMSHVLLRLRLNPEETKMIISTASGYLLIVHELDMNTLAQDMGEFGLERFEFAYWHQTIFASCQNWNHFVISKRRRNRVEIVADFPNACGLNIIPALEIHPRGWSAFSRCVSEVNGMKRLCVHDIQWKEPSDGGAALRQESGDKSPQQLARINEVLRSARGDWGSTGTLGRACVRFRVQSSNDSNPELPDAAFSPERRGRKRRSSSPADTARARSTPPGPSSATLHPLELDGLGSNRVVNLSRRVVNLSLPRPNPSVAQFNRRVHERFPRLTHYIEEPNSSDLYTDSLGVSADGRLVCSPLERGIRLLAFSPECSEQPVSSCGTYPRRLHELSTHSSHSGSVLCTKFSPRHCLLVSGGLDGKLTWYQPVV